MRVCAGCSADYAEDFSFCPHCGRAFGGGAEADRLNNGLRNYARQAERERSMESQLRGGGGSSFLTESAREGAAVLIQHDPLFASMVED